MAKDGEPESWEELAELASQEQDSEKLMALVAEINRLLQVKDKHTKDHLADENPEIAELLEEEQAQLLEEKQALLREERRALLQDGSTTPDAE